MCSFAVIYLLRTLFVTLYISALEIAENLVLADKSLVTDFPPHSSENLGNHFWFLVQWKLDLVDTNLAENLGLKDTPQKILGNHFGWFLVHKSAQNSENLVLADKSSVTIFSTK